MMRRARGGRGLCRVQLRGGEERTASAVGAGRATTRRRNAASSLKGSLIESRTMRTRILQRRHGTTLAGGGRGREGQERAGRRLSHRPLPSLWRPSCLLPAASPLSPSSSLSRPVSLSPFLPSSSPSPTFCSTCLCDTYQPRARAGKGGSRNTERGGRGGHAHGLLVVKAARGNNRRAAGRGRLRRAGRLHTRRAADCRQAQIPTCPARHQHLPACTPHWHEHARTHAHPRTGGGDAQKAGRGAQKEARKGGPAGAGARGTRHGRRDGRVPCPRVSRSAA